MFRRCTYFVMSLAFVAACSKKEPAAKSEPTPTPTTATTGSGSAAVAAGSDATGSAGSAGSAEAGSGSAAGDAGSAAIGGGSGSAAAAGSGSAADNGAPADGEVVADFDKLSHDEKVKVMKTKVMPAMKAAFQKFDPKEFANFTCKTCHGKDPQKAKYEMPTKDLPALDFEALKRGDEKEEAEFMANVVKPQMAKLLGKKEFHPDTQPDGFGCLHCHTQKK